MHLIKVGLTGGIAAGKSSVAELWRARGAAIIDSDVLARRALEVGTPTYEATVQEFGREVLNPDGSVNRAALGEIVFNDERQRQRLNAIVHPTVRMMWTTELSALPEQTNVAVVVIPLLFEVGAEKEFNCIVAVGCSRASQLARLRAGGLSEAQAQARIDAQWPVQQKLDRADYVIWNDGSRELLARQAEMIWNKIDPGTTAGARRVSHAT
jgi:dephospho-CoA kinase